MCIYLYIYNIQGVCVSIIYVSSDLFFFFPRTKIFPGSGEHTAVKSSIAVVRGSGGVRHRTLHLALGWWLQKVSLRKHEGCVVHVVEPQDLVLSPQLPPVGSDQQGVKWLT